MHSLLNSCCGVNVLPDGGIEKSIDGYSDSIYGAEQVRAQMVQRNLCEIAEHAASTDRIVLIQQNVSDNRMAALIDSTPTTLRNRISMALFDAMPLPGFVRNVLLFLRRSWKK